MCLNNIVYLIKKFDICNIFDLNVNNNFSRVKKKDMFLNNLKIGIFIVEKYWLVFVRVFFFGY